MYERGEWLQVLHNTPASERGNRLTSLVSGALRKKLLMNEADDLPIEKSYFELGLTSLGAVELQEDLETAIDSRVDATSIYNNPTVENLIHFLRTIVLTEFFKPTKNKVHQQQENTDQNNEEKNSARDLLNEMLNDFH